MSTAYHIYHEFYCNQLDIGDLHIYSRIVFNINKENTTRVLDLETNKRILKILNLGLERETIYYCGYEPKRPYLKCFNALI